MKNVEKLIDEVSELVRLNCDIFKNKRTFLTSTLLSLGTKRISFVVMKSLFLGNNVGFTSLDAATLLILIVFPWTFIHFSAWADGFGGSRNDWRGKEQILEKSENVRERTSYTAARTSENWPQYFCLVPWQLHRLYYIISSILL